MRISDWSSDVCSSDLLRDVFSTLAWEPPQIVVMGNENTGKSTLLERICMLPLFPTDKEICTRMAVKICLRRGDGKIPKVEVRARSEERRVGKECVSTCRCRGSRSH